MSRCISHHQDFYGHTINHFCIVLKRSNGCFNTGVLACPALFLFWKKLLFFSRFIWRANVIIFVRRIRRVWRYQRGNQNPYVEEEQTTQWPKEKVQKDKQRSTKHTHKTKDFMHCQKVKLVRTTTVLFIQGNLQQRDLQSFYKRK